jgi:hypothetical protein
MFKKIKKYRNVVLEDFHKTEPEEEYISYAMSEPEFYEGIRLGEKRFSEATSSKYITGDNALTNAVIKINKSYYWCSFNISVVVELNKPLSKEKFDEIEGDLEFAFMEFVADNTDYSIGGDLYNIFKDFVQLALKHKKSLSYSTIYG